MTDNIATIVKNSREEVRVALDSFSGHQLIDLRIYADFKTGSVECRGPTKKGISLKIERLPDLISALEMARKEAIGRGLLEA